MTPNTAPNTSPLLDEHRVLLAAADLHMREIDRRLAWIGNLRFALALIVIFLILLAIIDRLASPGWFLPPLLGFAVLSIFTEAARQKSYRFKQSMIYHERGIARIEDRWAGTGVPGDEYLQPDHPCAGDLDLFGKGSLFERLCLCATATGRDTLANWLLAPAEPAEIRRRQEAVRELSRLPNWRERAFVLGSEVRSKIATSALEEWGNLPVDSSRWPRIVAPILVGLTSFALAGWIGRIWPPQLIAGCLILQGGFAFRMMSRTQRATGGFDRRSRDLFQLVSLLASIEAAAFNSPLLKQLQESLRTDGLPPSQRLRRLARLIELMDQTHNFLFAMIAPFVLWTTQIALAIEAWRWQTGPALGRWLRAIGQIEALSSIAAFAVENPQDPFPEIADGPACFDAAELGHPLLPRSRCVTNDLRLDSQRRLLIISGSNMSGKSTLLRAAGINAVLAQMGASVRAKSLRLSRLVMGATLRIQDSLQEGKSRFYAEIARLRRVVDLASGPLPVLFLLDEILHGTNSHERKIGAETIVKGLLERDTVGLVTTHDLALTQLAGDLKPLAGNCHFSDDWIDGEMHFDYRLRDGPVTKSNALALMRAVGLKVDWGALDC